MDPIDVLLTLAEIGIAVAGFASLASVIGQTYTLTDPQVNAIRLRGLLNASLAIVFISLTAILLSTIDSIDPWRTSSIVGFVFSVVIGTGVIKRDQPRRHLPGYSKSMAVVNFSITGLVILASATAALGLWGSHTFSVFLASLILVLGGCSIAFVLVVTSLLDPTLRRS